MSVSSVNAKSTVSVQRIVEMSKQLDDLRRQLGTGKVSTNYAGLGIDRGLAVSLRTQINAISSFDQSIASVSTRLKIAQTTLTRLDESNHTVKSAAVSSAYVINQQGRTTDQFTAQNELDQMLALLNTRVGDQYIYSGMAADKPAVESMTRILDGDGGARAGLNAIMEERRKADGCYGTGRLDIPPASTAPAAIDGRKTSLSASQDLIAQGAVADNDTLTFTVSGHAPLTVTFGYDPGEVSTYAQLNAALAAAGGLDGGTATFDADNGCISVKAANTTDSITITGTANPAAFGLADQNGNAITAAAPQAGQRITVSQQLADHVFGFELVGVTSGLTNSHTAGPSGTPPAVTVDLDSNPKAGEKVSFVVRLPDGSTETLSLVASTNSPPHEGEFTIGADAAATTANLQTAVANGIGKMAKTSLAAASALTASRSFFMDNPPKRVSGTPPELATATVDATAANTIFWYTGENDPSVRARDTASGRIDPSITISYGMRANEQGIASTIATIAAYASLKFDESVATDEERYKALTQRVTLALDGHQGEQKIMNIEAEIAGAQTAMKGATDRHQQTAGTLEDLLQTITVAPIEEVSAKILTLQVRLQASLQTTALLSKTNLVNFL
jgi:predicted  nucleic acid-binding Zn-ribbon protein